MEFPIQARERERERERRWSAVISSRTCSRGEEKSNRSGEMYVRFEQSRRVDFPGNYSKNRISFLQYKGRRLCWQHESKISPSQGNNARRPPEMLRRSSLTCNHYGNTPSPELKAGLLSVQMHLLCWFSWINTSTHIPGWRIVWERLTERERGGRERRWQVAMVGVGCLWLAHLDLALVWFLWSKWAAIQLTHLGQTLTPQMWPCRSKKRTPHTPENHAVQPLVKK